MQTTSIDSAEPSSKLRAALFNLILYTKNDDRSAYIVALANKVTEKFPARILLVTVDESRNTIETTLPQEENETIAITVGPATESIVPYLILPHLLSDLPVYLVWPQNPSLLPNPLKKLSNRIIFDSEVNTDLSTFAKDTLSHYDPNGTDIADLNWARMESWRDLLGAIFHPQENLSHLQKATQITITYNCSPSPYFCHTQIQARYLQAWLTSRLDWKASPSFTLIPKEHPNLSPGNITALEIRTQEEVVFSFQRDPSFPHQISCEITTPTQCYLPSQFVFAKGEAGGSLIKEMSHRGTSAHYLGVLKQLL